MSTSQVNPIALDALTWKYYIVRQLTAPLDSLVSPVDALPPSVRSTASGSPSRRGSSGHSSSKPRASRWRRRVASSTGTMPSRRSLRRTPSPTPRSQLTALPVMTRRRRRISALDTLPTSNESDLAPSLFAICPPITTSARSLSACFFLASGLSRCAVLFIPRR